jgi:diadenosine tetraphosphate (Ap4A) HIT family hydrolase
MSCELCASDGGQVLHRDALLRVVLVDDADYPGFCRVILERHAREMTDLPFDERRRVMDAVFAVEEAVREVVAPHKVNVASLGNVVPHVHWHVIPRREDDRCFPAPIWAPPKREASPPPSPADLSDRLRTAVLRRLR